MAKKTYTIEGKVVDRKYELGIPGLKVVAWDKDLICDDFPDHRETDEQGRFRMEFSRAQFQEWFLDRKPDLFFKIYHSDEEIHSTRDGILWNYDHADEGMPVAQRSRVVVVIFLSIVDFLLEE